MKIAIVAYAAYCRRAGTSEYPVAHLAFGGNRAKNCNLA